MFNPSTSNAEFIELFNMSESEYIDLDSFQIIYHTSKADIIISHENNTLLPPQSYAVVLEGDYDFETGIYNNFIPDSSLIV
ncbi:hypothetical protein ACFLS9_09495, partial [Bacteroidota bacterium]